MMTNLVIRRLLCWIWGMGVGMTVLCAAVSVCIAHDPSEALTAGLRTPKTHDWPSFSCETMLHVEPATIAVGGTVRIRCELRCIRGSAEIYNGFLDDAQRLPAQIVVTSTDGTVSEELLGAEVKSHENRIHPWFTLGPSQAVGREFLTTVDKANELKGHHASNVRSIDLPAGEYYIQAIYNYWLIPVRAHTLPADVRPLGADKNEAHAIPTYSESQMGHALAISEPVKLIVMGDGGASESESAASPLAVELQIPKRVTVGRRAEVELKMVNRSKKTVEVYNPLLNGLLSQRAVELAFLTSDGTEVGDLLLRDKGSSKPPSKVDWTLIPPGGFVSTIVPFKAGSVPGSAFQGPNELPPGLYCIEFRARSPFVAGMPVAIRNADDSIDAMKQPGYEDWLRTFPGEEVLRKRANIEILPRTGD